jgi:hypothetical protein
LRDGEKHTRCAMFFGGTGTVLCVDCRAAVVVECSCTDKLARVLQVAASPRSTLSATAVRYKLKFNYQLRAQQPFRPRQFIVLVRVVNSFCMTDIFGLKTFFFCSPRLKHENRLEPNTQKKALNNGAQQRKFSLCINGIACTIIYQFHLLRALLRSLSSSSCFWLLSLYEEWRRMKRCCSFSDSFSSSLQVTILSFRTKHEIVVSELLLRMMKLFLLEVVEKQQQP